MWCSKPALTSWCWQMQFSEFWGCIAQTSGWCQVMEGCPNAFKICTNKATSYLFAKDVGVLFNQNNQNWIFWLDLENENLRILTNKKWELRNIAFLPGTKLSADKLFSNPPLLQLFRKLKHRGIFPLKHKNSLTKYESVLTPSRYIWMHHVMKSVTTFSQEVYKNSFGTSAVRSAYIFWIKKPKSFP